MNKPGRKQSSQKISINISGHLPVQYLDNFGSLTVTEMENGATMISGEIDDQAQLFGLLNRIRDLGIPLLGIDCCTNEFHTEEIDNEDK